MTEVRDGGPGDVRPAVTVWRRSNEARGKPPSQDRITRVLRKLTEPDAMLVVAVESDTVVGMALAEPGRAEDGALVPELCHLSMVFVDPEHWGRRVGAYLLDGVRTTAVHYGHTRLQVWTGATNHRALRLYQRSGFAMTGLSRLLPGGGPIVHLELPLP